MSNRFFFSAVARTSLTSLTPEFTALRVYKGASNSFASNKASVVFPTPGGPQRIIEGSLPICKLLRSAPF